MTAPNDIQFLQHAVRIGSRGLGRTWPNPSVGCVLVKDGAVIAVARSADGGRPHAETEALKLAGDFAKGATAYVSLEPCAHIGKTPPCAEALIKVGIARVVGAATDPDPRVSGKGYALLRSKGIEVVQHELPEALSSHAGFFRHVKHGLPVVALKLATSMDGYMANKKERWVTSERSRYHAHGIRARVDAVLTGIGTVLADDPLLTARLPGAENPYLVRVVADRQLKLPLDCQLVKTAEQQPTWLITSTTAIERNASQANDLRERGVAILALEDEELPPVTVLKALGAQGITRVLVESGPTLATHFLEAKCVDRLFWYRAPKLLGNTGAAAIEALEGLLEGARLLKQLPLGPDHCDIYGMDSCLPD